MRSVKNALGIADNTISTYGTTLPMGSSYGGLPAQGGMGGFGYGSSFPAQGYGSSFGQGYGFGTSGYGAQAFGNQGYGLGTSGLSSGYGAQQFGTSGLSGQALVSTTTVPIQAPMSPSSLSQSPMMTPSSFSSQDQFSNQNWQSQNLQNQNLQNQNWQSQNLQSQNLQSQNFQQPIQKQFQQGMVQRRESAPVIHERIRREEVEEIQPVIHREREKTEIHKITQPIQTSSTLGIITEEGTLPAQVNPEIRTPGMMSPPSPIGSREQLSGQRMRVEKPAVVIETEKKNIIEEVQPVVYKEIVEPHIIRLTQPIYERIVEGEVYFNETLPARSDFGQFQQRQLPQQQLPQQQQQFLQPIQVQTLVQPVPVAMASPMISQVPLVKENLEVAATYVSDVPYTKGRYGSKHSKGSAYAYGPGTTAAPLGQTRAV